MPWTVKWAVLIAGQDMTSSMKPYLTQITVTDKDGTASDSCSMDFDDAAGQVKLPAKGASVEVYLQDVPVFRGTVDTVRSSGSRGGGRMLSVGAKGFDAGGKIKELQSHHMDDATLQQFMDKAASRAGLSGVTIDPVFAQVKRDYWSVTSENFLHLGQRLAREFGGTFKIRGDRAVLAKRGKGATPSGGAMPTVSGRVGVNVISWEISPFSGRWQFSRAKVRYFDRQSASFKEVEVESQADHADATNEAETLSADEDQAKGIAEGRKAENEREGGKGTVVLDLEPTAQAEGTFVLSGARPGVDGTYRIAGVTHKADRGGGSTTSLELKQPDGGAGSDKRQPGQDPAGTGSSPSSSQQAEQTTGDPQNSYLDYNRRYGRTDEN